MPGVPVVGFPHFHDTIDVVVDAGSTRTFTHSIGRLIDEETGRIDIKMLEGDAPLEVVSLTANDITLKNSGSLQNKSEIHLSYYHSIVK